jgi:hypothetical protein
MFQQGLMPGGAKKRENLKSLEKHEGNFKTLFAPETVFYKSGNFIKKNPWSESASELYRLGKFKNSPHRESNPRLSGL